ncbi:hypothetical protein [Salinactinospora qingdaonensis]|uniref:Uncharacterized protein n=1 Tax=Salinactinospora qingdaonensis TaxID=702744 RepID=A0ABP7GBE5_9ACTN
MTEFLLGIVSSLAATAATLAGGWLLSGSLPQWILVAFSRLTGLGLQRIHKFQKAANSEVEKEVGCASWLKVMAGRGNELTRDAFIPIWSGENASLDFVQILLPDPDSAEYSWLTRREEELRDLDPGLGRGVLTQQVRANTSYLRQATKENEKVALRFYNLPNLWRVIATDRLAYITLYRSGEHGRNSPCLVARRPGYLYDFALSLFTAAWRHSRPACGEAAEPS